jgi:tRNA pseudouridine38-40 synthase
MPRYFIEVAYKGSRYSGFQVQENADTIQSEVEKAFSTLHRQAVPFTGSSRTDAGVHALQNYFHFDYEAVVNPNLVYKMNAILPDDIVVRSFHAMPPEAHSRFDAVSREYEYRIVRVKNPFLKGMAYRFPYTVDMDRMNEAAGIVTQQSNFFAFSKTNTQVKNFICQVEVSRWHLQDGLMIYNIKGNRFLRGMVRLLTASLLKVGRGHWTVDEFAALFGSEGKCGYSVPSDGLFLKAVNYPEGYFPPLSEDVGK